MHPDVERDLYNGDLTESANGGEAGFELLTYLVVVPIALIVRGIMWLVTRR